MKKPIEEIIDDYLNLIQPEILITKLTKDEFDRWLEIDLLEDETMYIESLKLTLIAFQQRELYEYCSIIKNKIDNFIENNLSN